MVMLTKQSKKEVTQFNEKVIEIERKKVIANAEKKEKSKEWTKMLLRVKNEFLNQIDMLIEDEIGMNRTIWILEAIQEKIKRENKRKLND